MADKIMLYKDLMEMYSQAKTIRQPYENLWKDVIEYAAPRYYNLDGQQQPGNKVGQKMYDGTITSALRIWTDGFYGYMVSQAYRWFTLGLPVTPAWARTSNMRSFNGKRVDDIPEVRQWLQDCEEELYGSFRRSNFYDAIKHYIYEGGSIGTSTLYCEEDKSRGSTVYIPCHCGEIFIAEDQYGKVDTLFRRIKMTARQCEQRWGKDKLTLPMKNDLENSNRSNEYEITHIVMPRKDAQRDKKDSKNKPIASYYLADQNDIILNESGYDDMPYSVWRVYKVTGEIYGRSPTSDCIIEVIKSHTMSKDLLTAAQMSVWPPWVVPEHMRGKISREPWGVTYYDQMINQGQPMGPIETRMNYPIGIDREQRTQQIIEEHFNVEFFMMLSRAEQQMTATEIMERQGEKAVLLGSAVGSFTNQCLDAVIDRQFAIDQEAGRIPSPPDLLYELQGATIEIDYLGPLAQAQKRLFRTQGIQAGLMALAPLAQVKPEVLDIIDWDRTARETLEATGFPASCILTQEKADALKAKTIQAMEQQRMLDQAEQAGKALPGYSKAIEEGSPLNYMMTAGTEEEVA